MHGGRGIAPGRGVRGSKCDERLGDFARAVGGVIVDDDDFEIHTGLRDQRLQTSGERRFFVARRDDDGDFDSIEICSCPIHDRIYYYKVCQAGAIELRSIGPIRLLSRCSGRSGQAPEGGRPHMSIYRSRIVQCVVRLAGVALLLTSAGCYSRSRPARIGSAAPDFTVRDAQRSVTLSHLKGQIVVLNFWATWCPPCVEEMPSLVQMQAKMKDKGITVLAISVDQDEDAYHRFLQDHGVNLLSVRDADQKSNDLYGTFKFPETYIIDRNGVVRRKFIGAVDWTEPDVIEYLGKL